MPALRLAAVLVAVVAAVLLAASAVQAAGPAPSPATPVGSGSSLLSSAPAQPSAASGATTTSPTTGAGASAKTRLDSSNATGIFLATPKVRGWLSRYPADITTTASFSNGVWQINVFYGNAGEIASGKVDDLTAQVTEAYTGPQVAWGMARGGFGFGGRQINSWQYWIVFCLAFLIGLIDWRRPLSLRTVDLLMLLSFSPSLWLFNHGHIFAAFSLIYPGFAWLIARCLWIARRNRGVPGPVVWPTWVMLVATLALIGFRIDLNWNHSDVIDVGLSGVIGANRLASFQSPYGHFPTDQDRPPCGPADADGNIRDHIQTNGRCESADALGDTYGPVAYEAYLPGYAVFGWSHHWDTLPTAHATSILWDLLAMIGLLLVGLRLGGPRLGATLAFAWAAWPFTQYASNSNTNDLIMPALLIWGFLFVMAPIKRGIFSALSGWTKFASLLVLPLWSGYPDAALLRPRLRYLAGVAVGTALAFSVVLFERHPLHNLGTFFHHTIGFQFGREAPFSLWDWKQYHARGIPDLSWVQAVLRVALVGGAVVLARWPRHRTPLRLAAYTAVLLVGFEAVLTYWSFSYLAWFFPFAAFAVLAPRTATDDALDDQWRSPFEVARERWTPEQIRTRLAVGGGAVFLGSWALLTHGFYANQLIIDTPVYQEYGEAIRKGLLPYRDFAVEYPPGALPPFIAATFGGFGYRSTFGWLMAACGLLCLLFVALCRPPGRAWVFLAVAPLLIGGMTLTRFDFWPALFVIGALAAFVRGRHKLGWGALGAAIGIKLFPVVLVPLVGVWTYRQRGRAELLKGIDVFAAVLIVVFVPFLVFAPHGLWNSIAGELSRPVQIETLPATFLKTFGNPQIVGSHGSFNLAHHGSLAVLLTALLLASLVSLWVAFARGPVDADRLMRYAAACICAFVVFGKVLSPQFLIWLVPLVPLVRGRRGLVATVLLALALVNTLVWFPNRYYPYVDNGHLAWLIFLRDLTLLALFAVLALPDPTDWARRTVAGATGRPGTVDHRFDDQTERMGQSDFQPVPDLRSDNDT